MRRVSAVKQSMARSWSYMFGVLLAFLCLFLYAQTASAATVSSLVTFDNPSDLTDLFNHDGSPVFTNIANGGINGTGSVNVPIPSNDLWTTKQGYSVTGAAGSVYTFSAYFLVAQNSGYGNLGFTNLPSSNGTGIGQPATGIGVNFHGGGGAFVNNGTQTSLSWPPDLVLGNWYWFTFEVVAKGSNTFDLKLQIWNTDSSGVIGTMKTEKTLANVTNTTLGSAPVIYAFFSAAGSRMSKIDNFAMELVGSTFVSAGYPVVVSGSSAADVSSTTASFGGTVTSDQGDTVTARGVCWAQHVAPTTADACNTNGAGLGTFTASLTGLTPETTYHARAYATNALGTSYGVTVAFVTQEGSTDINSDDTEGISENESTDPQALSDTGDGTWAAIAIGSVAILLGMVAMRRI